jgi:hypothetical protein
MAWLLTAICATLGGPDVQLLFDSLGDVLAAKTGSDRAAAQRAVNLIFAHGNLGPKGDETGPDDAILRQFEAITDDERRTAFYSKHKKEILAAFEARKSNNP